MSDFGLLMSRPDVKLEPAPIHPDWILEGAPHARYRMLFRSQDGTSSTVIWDCTAGMFNWYYNCDETIQVMEGGVVFTTKAGTQEVGPGDVVFFPAGTHAVWQVDHYVRKVAFLRHPLPWPAGFALRVWRRLVNGRSKSRMS